jgi:hypothetical protein
MNSKTPRSRLPAAAIVMIAVPTVAVIASFITLGVALSEREPALPDNFNFEGVPLERDMARAARAAEIGVRATLNLGATDGTCRASFAADAAPPDVLVVQLTHATIPDLDRTIAMRAAVTGYLGRCEKLPQGRWYITLSDTANSWRIRQEFSGSLERIDLAARSTSIASR